MERSSEPFIEIGDTDYVFLDNGCILDKKTGHIMDEDGNVFSSDGELIRGVSDLDEERQ